MDGDFEERSRFFDRRSDRTILGKNSMILCSEKLRIFWKQLAAIQELDDYTLCKPDSRLSSDSSRSTLRRAR